jgi:hypothetical protein
MASMTYYIVLKHRFLGGNISGKLSDLSSDQDFWEKFLVKMSIVSEAVFNCAVTKKLDRMSRASFRLPTYFRQSCFMIHNDNYVIDECCFTETKAKANASPGSFGHSAHYSPNF